MVILCDKPYTNSKYDNYFELYPYPLSDFQKYAIEAIVEEQNVLVTAHTGSGKTLPAEFAITHFTGKNKKVIYTSPIKALSNQKFYEFTQKYPHISFGLITGDIKTNPNADVLIMTTEILMNYLFSVGPDTDVQTLQFQIDIQKELACVIFDEVHYINDADRGQTWEQTILMLPVHIQLVMLSATIDNPFGFAKWVENRGFEKSVYLSSTEHRVVPLTHYAYFTTTETPFKEIKDKEIQKQIRDSSNKLVLLRDPSGNFNESGYYEIKKMRDLFEKHRFFMKRKFVLNKLAGFLKDNEMLPAIVFVFSRKSVELCAHEITTNLLEDDSKIPYIVRRECEQIVRKFPNFNEYLELPEYNDLVALLEKGIGIHHSGMIPVLKEIVELMISKKYIKLLFATESFAIGLDCPIKTAVFSNITKYDGTNMRTLLPHEYTQMAGRAGRRGIDVIGNVVHCNNLFDIPTLNEYKQVLCGKPQKLISKFRISYPTVLNLMKNGTMHDFHHFVDKSMMKNELAQSIITCQKKLLELNELYDKKTGLLSIVRTQSDICNEYIELEENYQLYSSKKRKEIDRKLKDMKESNRWLTEDIARLKDYRELKKSVDAEKYQLDALEKYTKIHTEKICDILIRNEFIERVTVEDSESYAFTESGNIAANINEIHPLLAANMLVKWNWFSEFSTKQLISLFSIFTNVNIDEEYASAYPETRDSFIKHRIIELQLMGEQYDKEERDVGVYTGIKYDELFCFYLIDTMVEWTNCESETQCKYMIQTNIKSRGISIGDFTKAILKIAVIAKEFIGICEMVGNSGVELLYKLKEIEPAILKYVATAQSLYI